MMGKEGEKWPAIGIDLGTTYSCVGVWRHDRVEIITNDQGNRTTPSCIAFTKNDSLIGDAAKNQESINPTNTIFDAKRLIGRRFDEETVQNDMKLWPFKVIGDSKSKLNKPMIEVGYKGEIKQFSPEQISAMVLTKMKDVAESFLGVKVKNAVVTVPAYFNDSQRRATKDAGVLAGLNVLRIINEPSAAALAYGLDTKACRKFTEKKVLIFDLGGGTLDVSMIVINNDKFEVLGVAGNTHLSGSDFDNRILDHFVQEFMRKHRKDLRGNPKALGRLRAACDRAKRILSSSSETTIVIDYLFDQIDFCATLSRSRFEMLNMDLFKECVEIVDKCLRDVKVNKKDIDDVVLIGGSTRIPKVQQLLQELFKGNELCRSINPDEAVAYGAAIHAATLCGMAKAKNIVLVDVTPLSLGLGLVDGGIVVVIPRNTPIPATMEKETCTAYDNMISQIFRVYQGERLKAEENHCIGKFLLHRIPPAPRGLAKFKTIFTIDADGVLTVSSRLKGTSNENKLTITDYRGRLANEEVGRMVKQAKQFRAEDEEYVKKNKAARLQAYERKKRGLIFSSFPLSFKLSYASVFLLLALMLFMSVLIKLVVLFRSMLGGSSS